MLTPLLICIYCSAEAPKIRKNPDYLTRDEWVALLRDWKPGLRLTTASLEGVGLESWHGRRINVPGVLHRRENKWLFRPYDGDEIPIELGSETSRRQSDFWRRFFPGKRGRTLNVAGTRHLIGEYQGIYPEYTPPEKLQKE